MSPSHRGVDESWAPRVVAILWVLAVVSLVVLTVFNAIAGNWLVTGIAVLVIVVMGVDELRRRLG